MASAINEVCSVNCSRLVVDQDRCEPQPPHTALLVQKKCSGAGASNGNCFGLGTEGDIWPSAAWGSLLLTSSFTLALVSFLNFAALASFSVSRTSCLMNPPGMTDRSRGGVDGGGPRSSSRICLREQRLGYGARCRDRSPGKASPSSTLAARAAELSPAPCPASGRPRASCRRSARPVWGCCSEQKHREEKPAEKPLGFHTPPRAGCCGEPVCAASSAQRPAARAQPREEPWWLQRVKQQLPASLQPHADLRVAPCQAPSPNQPHFAQLLQQRAFSAVSPNPADPHEVQPCREPWDSNQQNHSNQCSEAAKVPGACSVGHSVSTVRTEPRGHGPSRHQAGCSASPRLAPSPRAPCEHPAPNRCWYHPGPRLSFCSQSARREEMAMVVASRDGAEWRTAGPCREHGAGREERVSQGLPLAPELGRGLRWGR